MLSHMGTQKQRGETKKIHGEKKAIRTWTVLKKQGEGYKIEL